jgi:hypothetical protein
VQKVTGKTPKQLLDAPECPKELEYIFYWFNQLVSSNQLSYQEIQSWSYLTKTNVEAWEVEALTTLDAIYWTVIHER